MLNVVTVNAGNYQGRGVEYTNILHDSVRRNLPDGYEGRFIVFTDDPDGYDDGIIVRPLPHEGLVGWWNKLALFKPGVFATGDRVLYLDLSCVIAGRLDAIANYVGPFAILRDFYRYDGLQSSVMAWPASNTALSVIWERWEREGKPEVSGGDQSWIERCFSPDGQQPDLWQDIFPGAFVSYKVSLGAIPNKAAVCVFHGHPKPHECDGWVPRVWKVGGLTRAELDMICNVEREAWMANVRVNSARNLPWMDYAEKHELVSIVGGSPSVEKSLPDFTMRQFWGQEIWALNGAFKWLLNHGIKPTAHVIIDAKLENLAFIVPTKGVKYYLASQCAPALFDALEGYDVTVLQLLTEGMEEYLSTVPGDQPCYLMGAGTTVALKAMLCAEMLGAKSIMLYGMDSCYSDDKHHAYKQEWNDGERTMDALYGDRMFKCAGWMVQQANDFIEFARRFEGVIAVAGDGLLAYIARCGIPEMAADTRAREILKRLGDKPATVAEIGIFAGELSRRLLDKSKIERLYMVDAWGKDCFHGEPTDFHQELTPTEQERFMGMALKSVAKFNGRTRVIRNDSVAAADQIPHGSLDLAFIDADHSYEGCKRDIEAWRPKVKPGGYLSGHDYDNKDYPDWGVKQAVDEFAKASGSSLELGDNFTWFIQIGQENGL